MHRSMKNYPERFYDKRSGEYRPVPAYGEPEPVHSGAKRRAENRKKRRRWHLCIFYILLFLFVLSAGTFLAIKVLFKINSIKVEGTSCYTMNQIKQNSGLKIGESLIMANTREAEDTICKKLPYIGTVKITRHFPDEIAINVSAAVASGAIQCDKKYIVVSESGKVLEVTGSLPANSALIKGVDVLAAKTGEQVKLKDASKTEILKNVLQVLDTEKLKKITSMDFTKTSRICLVYDGRITVNLGVPSDLGYKVRFAKNVLQNKIQSNEKGTLDMSTTAENDRAYFDPEYDVSSSSSG